ncbi:hypothetical protein BT63DRAFT_475127 [Microthyrium microscopicum]|uniref:RBR-type E3 ubiquitin transferase n=1 Tax=Microthyrium microscopicum TaxID=703497 RepID=A0A6A6UT65_9PEZI|nr:hypothetical protein BT63DRAFT_475127 [Microthyrium microscopicum]
METFDFEANPLTFSCHLCGNCPDTVTEAVCCGTPICSDCWRRFLQYQLEQQVWMCEDPSSSDDDLSISDWMCCPIATCQREMGVERGDQLDAILEEMDVWTNKFVKEAHWGATVIRHILLNLQKMIPQLAGIDVGELRYPDCLRDLGNENFRALRYAIRQEDSSLSWVEDNRLYMQWKGDDAAICYYITDLYDRESRVRECSICTETMTEVQPDSVLLRREVYPRLWRLSRFPKIPRSICKHPVEACMSCYREYIETQLDLNGAPGCDRLPCPECSRILNGTEIRFLMPRGFLERLDNFRLHNLLSREPGFRWCLRIGCKSGAFYDYDNAAAACKTCTAYITCMDCRFKMCFYHQIPWHEDLTCKEYDSTMASRDSSYLDMVSLTILKEQTKICPNPTCQLRIQKNEGCSHMHCTRCGTNFCWTCSGIILDEHHHCAYYDDDYGEVDLEELEVRDHDEDDNDEGETEADDHDGEETEEDNIDGEETEEHKVHEDDFDTKVDTDVWTYEW